MHYIHTTTGGRKAPKKNPRSSLCPRATIERFRPLSTSDWIRLSFVLFWCFRDAKTRIKAMNYENGFVSVWTVP